MTIRRRVRCGIPSLRGYTGTCLPAFPGSSPSCRVSYSGDSITFDPINTLTLPLMSSLVPGLKRFARYGWLNHTTLRFPVSSPATASVALMRPPSSVSLASQTFTITVCSASISNSETFRSWPKSLCRRGNRYRRSLIVCTPRRFSFPSTVGVTLGSADTGEARECSGEGSCLGEDRALGDEAFFLGGLTPVSNAVSALSIHLRL